MDRQQHDAFVNELLSVEQAFDSLDITNLELTPEEASAVALYVPEETLASVQEITESYTPRSGVDIRYTLVLKLLGLLATRAQDRMKEAFHIGWNAP